MTRQCSRCGKPFLPARAHHRFCWACFRRDQEQDTARGDAYRTGFVAGAKAAAGVIASSGLDAGLLREAVTLCHPDRHPAARAEQATRVTAALLELLETARLARRRAA